MAKIIKKKKDNFNLQTFVVPEMNTFYKWISTPRRNAGKEPASTDPSRSNMQDTPEPTTPVTTNYLSN